ncbi:MAG TPA: cytochrome b N-terminal domain-containing protein [Candidatus Saccharimonadales bacterium]|nr:cytochrome b N-terminal domain-containing protein [Candidatus Saccharimonadales bacterium]
MNRIINMPFAALVNLNQPGNYVHWSIFTISVANLVIIAVMVVIFGLALLLPFPKGRREEDEELRSQHTQLGVDLVSSPHTNSSDSKMWTARVRNFGLRILPPGKLLPDRQPAYVSSWIYVFGVATLAALGMVVISGMALAIGGPDWWHVNPIGHFFNSMHIWSVELFMAFMVIHLWGKFWVAAWRGKRKLTWITGVVAFLASIIECFTGYLSQQNFDSQWIATNGKDAINATGLGTFFNLMNFGQMLMWHIVLIPIVLVALIGAHVLLVRVRGVAHPIQKRPHGRAARRAAKAAEAMAWRGPTRRYDILKEGTIATIVVFILVVGLAAILSSPDEPPVTVASWAKVAPADFMGTAASELAGTSETATYGPPYNNGTSNVQKIGVSWQMLTGVHQPINAAQTFVLSPLSKVAPTDLTLAKALSTYQAASSSQQQAWNQAYANAVTNVTFVSGVPKVPKAKDGPIPTLISTELTLAQSGAVDADLLAQQPFYGTNYTKPLLFMEDGSYFSSLAQQNHLSGTQWGVMNETGKYPGQPWLWLYTLWYQVPGFSSSANVDLIAIYLTGLATILLLAVPFIPGLRDIPRLIPVHKLIWRKRNHSKANP